MRRVEWPYLRWWGQLHGRRDDLPELCSLRQRCLADGRCLSFNIDIWQIGFIIADFATFDGSSQFRIVWCPVPESMFVVHRLSYLGL